MVNIRYTTTTNTARPVPLSSSTAKQKRIRAKIPTAQRKANSAIAEAKKALYKGELSALKKEMAIRVDAIADKHGKSHKNAQNAFFSLPRKQKGRKAQAWNAFVAQRVAEENASTCCLYV